MKTDDTHPRASVDGTDPGAVTHSHEREESPSRSVVAAVAAVTGSDPRQMEPLAETIDTDALDRVVEPRSGGSSNARVTFRFNGCLVTVHGDGRTVVSPPETD